MEEELKYLKFVLEKYDEVLDDSLLKLKNLQHLFKDNYDALLEEKFKLEKGVDAIGKAKLNPYFARIDFKTNNRNESCYIGKLGVSDYDNNIITVDWRAPISTLYYDSNIGKCSYESPEGNVQGELLLKRQYTIENSKLINFHDVDTVSNDELLQPYLNVSSDNRLKNIVSTIQSEQNKIIREKINKNLVIQGVAGSGKTTVALHRIAYLVYNNRELFKPSDYMVIGPNKFFVNYISGILPDLDVNGVNEYTLEEVFETYLKEDFTVFNSLDKLYNEDNTSAFKTSLLMKDKIDNYMSNLSIIPSGDFCIDGIKILDGSYIIDIYNGLDKNTFKSIKSRVDKTVLLLNKHLEDDKQNILAKLIRNNVDKKIIDIVKNNLLKYLKLHFTILNKSVKSIYIDILTNLNFNHDNIKKNIIEIEDIPSMIYINYCLNGPHIYDNIKHIVIDEAQDYGIFAFYVLEKIFKNATFSIYGDLAQSLYSYRSINNWNELNKIFEDLQILRLNKSYRTTIEIMQEANKINRLLHLDEAESVIRHGDVVEYTNKDIVSLIKELSNNYKTIAVITKTQNDANEVYNSIRDKISVDLINSNNLNYNSNISILPSYLSKGLEFDSVIILNPDNEYFNKNRVLDMKLLYVSETRALHKLYIKIG